MMNGCSEGPWPHFAQSSRFNELNLLELRNCILLTDAQLRKDYWQGVCQEFRDVLKLLCVREGLTCGRGMSRPDHGRFHRLRSGETILHACSCEGLCATDDPNFDEFCWGKTSMANPKVLPEPCRRLASIELRAAAQAGWVQAAHKALKGCKVNWVDHALLHHFIILFFSCGATLYWPC